MLSCSSGWRSQPYSRGSYTFIKTGATQGDIYTISSPVFAPDGKTVSSPVPPPPAGPGPLTGKQQQTLACLWTEMQLFPPPPVS